MSDIIFSHQKLFKMMMRKWGEKTRIKLTKDNFFIYFFEANLLRMRLSETGVTPI